jgi:transcriptional regulator with XRE-family HTH domain
MPARREPGSKRLTRLAAVRLWRGATQKGLADKVGMSRRTLQRLELGQGRNPPLRSLTNCAKALGVPLEAIVEPEWLDDWWDPFGALEVPPEEGFWPVAPRVAWGRERPDWLGPDQD